jgi:hypothetical protein
MSIVRNFLELNVRLNPLTKIKTRPIAANPTVDRLYLRREGE